MTTMMHALSESPGVDVSADRATLIRDGIVGLKGAFSRDWAERMREDMLTGFWEAIQRPGGAVGRGPRRWYVEIHPQPSVASPTSARTLGSRQCAGLCLATIIKSSKLASTLPLRGR
jgi:hypothetical protein